MVTSSWHHTPYISMVKIVAVMVLGVVVVDAATELECNSSCSCWVKGDFSEEYRVICNNTVDKHVRLTKKVFSVLPAPTFSTYVRVEDVESLSVDEDFLEEWRSEFHSCAFDLWRAGSVDFPVVTSRHFAEPSGFEHVFAGIGVISSTLNHLPSGIFRGKQEAGLRLQQSSVGVMPPGLFRGVGTLKYFTLESSRVGLFQGPAAGENGSLSLGGPKKVAVRVQDSDIGFLGPGAFAFDSSEVKEVELTNVTIGSVAVGGVDLSGHAQLSISNSTVSDLQSGSLVLRGSKLTIINSTVAARPSALQAFPCSYFNNHIVSNHILVSSPVPLPLEREKVVTDANGTTTATQDDFSGRDLARWLLETVLDPSCVPYNLPEWAHSEEEDFLTLPPLGSPQVQDVPPILHLGLYSFVGISMVALVIVVILACLLVRAKRRRPGHERRTPPIALSQLQDPIYEDAPFLALSCAPPPVPPPTTLLRDKKDSGNTKLKGSCEGAAAKPKGAVDNDYMVMKAV
ncbi:uncharacterized protein LOC125034286 [Penaeus chinensis]|uniref:uncharacterized protein LOC125034286 n=1 Tax=Penaeus chinensis TaxID=139456 RepID=UPI001FB7D155|nr:uncharacterized protein LOC125034286 [Penaeus chinensis]